MPTLRVSKTSRMLKSQLNKGFISIIWLTKSQVSANKRLWETLGLCAKPLHQVSSMVMFQSVLKQKLPKKLAQNIRWLRLKMVVSRFQTMTCPWPSVFVKETASKWNKSIRSLLESAKRNVLNWWITSLTSNLQIRLMRLKKETSLVRWAISSLRTGHNSYVVQELPFLSQLSVQLWVLSSVLWLVFTAQLLRLLINL